MDKLLDLEMMLKEVVTRLRLLERRKRKREHA
jgi:hypothetical protein